MLVLVTYDVDTTSKEGERRLRKVAKECVNYGQRVQNSVFECDLDAALFVVVKNKLISIIDEKKDSVRFYNLGNSYVHKIEHYGIKVSYDPEGDLFL